MAMDSESDTDRIPELMKLAEQLDDGASVMEIAEITSALLKLYNEIEDKSEIDRDLRETMEAL